MSEGIGEQIQRRIVKGGVEDLADLQLSLSEVLGSDWKEGLIYQSVEEALKGEGVKSLEDGCKIPPREQGTPMCFVAKALNKVFESDGSGFRVGIVEANVGYRKQKKYFIAGQVGEDVLFQTTKGIGHKRTVDGKSEIYSWSADVIGIVGGSGNVFRLDKLLTNNRNLMEREARLSFVEGGDYKYKNAYLSGRLGGKVVGETSTSLPKNYREMGILLHEIGHLLRMRFMLSRPQMMMAYSYADDVLAARAGKKSHLSGRELRRVKADDERGAWAIGLSLIREVGKEIGLGCASEEAIKTILEEAEWSLDSYDVSYDSKLGNEDVAFTNARKKEMRGGKRRK